MTSRSTPANRNATARMFRTLKFTFLTPDISHWTRLQMRSPHWSEALSVLYVERSWRGTMARPSTRTPAKHPYWIRPFKQRGIYVKQENSNRHGSIAGYWCGFGRGLPEGGE